MSDLGDAQSVNVWPLPKFYFEVEIGGDASLGFQAVEGLEVEVSVIEYRAGNMPDFHKVKMPGMKTYANVTLKKGVFSGDMVLWDWLSEIKMNLIERKDVLIKMLDADGTPLLTWALSKAFPVKFVPSELNAEDDGDPAIEELELAFESFTTA